jgi:Trp operon repressor
VNEHEQVSLATKVDIINDWKNSALSVRKLSAKYGVGKTSIGGYIKRRAEIMDEASKVCE